MRFSRLHISFAFVNAVVVTSAVAILHHAQLVSVRILASLQTYHCATIFRIATLPRRFLVVPTAPRMNMSSRVTSMYKIHTLSIKHMFQIADTPAASACCNDAIGQSISKPYQIIHCRNT
ncbi:hypothetical protein NP493_402g02051 [Ridgeia piscesae]|uniref:Uncharacterized protein n=1 Tax=Ridgeia piscesae TaxID=27915 RepID=A0AAD9L0W9_RIDPI|nr:hypothetical protein NP493_402g02051 [Ridgeia piscesae]